MKKYLIALVLLTTTCIASGPKYNFQDPHLYDEFVNAYHDIKNPGSINVSNLYINGVSQIALINHVYCQTLTNKSTTSSTFQATNLTCSITPTSTASRILIFMNGNIRNDNANATNMFFTIFRGATNLGDTNNGLGGIYNGTVASQVGIPASVVYQDTPSSLSQVTYTVKIRSSDNTTNVVFPDATAGNMLLVEINP